MPIDVKKYIDVDSQDTPIIVYRDKMPVLDTLNVTPTVVAQEIVPETGVDGFNKVNVSAVNASIDSNIIAENIKAGVNILGVVGNLDTESFGMTADGWGGSGVDDYGRIVYTGQHTPNFKGVRVLGASEFNRKFAGRSDIVGNIDFSDLETIGSMGMQAAFEQSGIMGVDLSSLVSVDAMQAFQYAFNGSQINNFNLNNLETVTGRQAFNSAFYNTPIQEGFFPKLKKLSGDTCFYGIFYLCPQLELVMFPALEEITGGRALQNAFVNTKLTDLSFPSLKPSGMGSDNYQFNQMLSGVSGCVVRFPSNLESVIGNWPDVLNGFGGTNMTVLFNLPATE